MTRGVKAPSQNDDNAKMHFGTFTRHDTATAYPRHESFDYMMLALQRIGRTKQT